MTRNMASTADSPDLDWSQVHETVVLLNLAVARISHAMREGDDSVISLTAWFTEMVENMQNIAIAAKQLPDSETKNMILNNSDMAAEKVEAAIIAFQFHDKLTQRLNHVSKSLEALSEQVSDPERLYSPQQWQQLQDRIRAKYTLDSDLQILEAILQGKSIEEALKETPLQAVRTDDGDIEFF